MSLITNDTKYSEIREGDTMPNGDTVVGVQTLAEYQTTVVKLTTQADEFASPVTYGGVDANETYGQSLARAQFMSNLTDHS